MIEHHYDDEALITLLETDGAAGDAHLPSCSECSERLVSFGAMAGALRDEDVWKAPPASPQPVASTIATLRAFAQQLADEDRRADTLVATLLEGTREQWAVNLAQHPECRTVGVVRALVERAYDAVVTMPPDAVAMMVVATEIADHLDPSSYPSDTVARLRGTAWRDRAYALYYTGRFGEALAAVERADRELSTCVVDEYDRARVGIVKALVLRAFERLDEAESVADVSTKTFMAFDDLERVASARMNEARVLFSRNEFAKAELLLTEIEIRLRDSQFAETHARVLGNLGYCAYKTRKLDVAIGYLEHALALFEGLDSATEAVRTRWIIAATLAQAGHLTEAYERLQRVSAEMDRLGMTSEAACNALEMAELLLAEERYNEVEAICRRAIESFERAGVGYTARALTALAYVSEATRNRKATPALVRNVREYIGSLPKQPNLLFAPPPFLD